MRTLNRAARRRIGRSTRDLLDRFYVLEDGVLDYALSGLHAVAFERPHSCFRNALDALYAGEWSGTYVEGWLYFGDPAERFAHAWLVAENGKIIDGSIIHTARVLTDHLTEAAKKKRCPIRFVQVQAFSIEDVDAHLAESELIPIVDELYESIVDDARRNPDHFHRIAKRQALYDRS